jgi:hypothetical protein
VQSRKIGAFFFLSCVCLNYCFLGIGKVQTLGGLCSLFFWFSLGFSETKQKFVTFFDCQAKDIALLSFYCLFAFRVLLMVFFFLGWGLGNVALPSMHLTF